MKKTTLNKCLSTRTESMFNVDFLSNTATTSTSGTRVPSQASRAVAYGSQRVDSSDNSDVDDFEEEFLRVASVPKGGKISLDILCQTDASSTAY